jgi:hypothetical protein
MDTYETGVSVVLGLVAVMAAAVLLQRVVQRLQLSFAKHPSLGGHLRMSKRFANWLPAYSYSPETWFSVDGAPTDIAHTRQTALRELGDKLKTRSPLTLAQTAAAKPMIALLAKQEMQAWNVAIADMLKKEKGYKQAIVNKRNA